jgi:transcriptional regulator with XRE-family HTH domain
VNKEMKIGDRIKQRREELGLSQDELAKKLGYKSRSSVNKIERDASGLPQNKIVEIANALQVTPAYIMGWDKIEQKNNALVGIISRLRTDDEFLNIVKMLSSLDDGQLNAVKQMLIAFVK